MNVPTKALKNISSQPSLTNTIGQSILKKYNKFYEKEKSKNKKSHKNGEADSSMLTSLMKDAKINSRCNFQEEALKWFFSLNKTTRFKICSLKNKPLVNILYQMYVHAHMDPKVKFQVRNVYNEEVEEVYPIICTNNSNTLSFINVNNGNFKSGENTLAHYLNYFLTNNNVQSSINLKNFIRKNDIMEREFVKEIKFFNCEDHNDTMVLSPSLLNNESEFRKYFEYFTNDKFFNSYINIMCDQNKQFHLSMPDWVNNRDHYTFFQLVVAYFEQAIMTWFCFSKNMDQKSFDALLCSLPHDEKVTSIIEDLEKVVGFCKEKLTSNAERKKMLDEISLKNITLSIKKDHKVAELINLRKKIRENISQYCYTNLYYHHFQDNRCSSEVLEDIEHIFRCHIYNMTEERFVHNLIFCSFDKLFLYDDFFGKKLWEEIHNMYTNKNALELIIEEMDNTNQRKLSSHSTSKTLTISSETNKKKKNPKKNKKIKKYEKEENSPSTSSSDEKKEEKSLKIVRSNKNLEPIKNTDHYGNIEQQNTNKVLKENVEVQKKTKELNANDSDTAYSSSNISDTKNNVKSLGKNKKEKKFFLYTTKPKEQKNKNISKENSVKDSKPILLKEEKDKPAANNKSEILSQKIEADVPKNKEAKISIKVETNKIDYDNHEFIKEDKSTSKTPINNNSELNTNSLPENSNSSLSINISPRKHSYPGHSGRHLNRNFLSTNNPYYDSNRKSYVRDEMQIGFCPLNNSNQFGNFNSYEPFEKILNYGALHSDIINYSREVNENIISLKEIKNNIIKKIEEMISICLIEYNIALTLYGSFASDLEIESSDIDIMIKYHKKSQSYSTQENIMNQIVKDFTSKNIFDIVNPIYSASVPVIKLQFEITSLLNEKEKRIWESFKESKNYKNYKFNREDLEKVKIDLTFMNVSGSSEFSDIDSASQKAVDFIKNSIFCFPEIKPLIQVLKRLLQIEKLNCSFKGGLSSFGLFLLVLAFMKMKKFNPCLSYPSLGSLLVEFLNFYANFNFNRTFIDVNSINPFIVNPETLDQIPLILDPITYLNVAKSSYRIDEIKQRFSKCSNFISCEIFNSKISNFKSAKENIIFSLLKINQSSTDEISQTDIEKV